MKIYLIVFAGIFIISRIFSMILEHKFKRNINHTYYGSRSSKKRLIKRFNKKLKLEQKYQDKRQEKHNKKIMKMEQKN